MARKKGKRRIILLECTKCGLRSHVTQKNTDNTPDKLELKKYCSKDQMVTTQKETQKLD